MQTVTGKCADFLTSLYAKGVRLWLDGSQLHYHARQGVLTAPEIATLRAMKEEIIAVLDQRRAAAVDPAHLLGTRRSPSDLAPLTVQQEMMWKAYERGALSFLWPSALRLSGSLNPELLRSSIDALIRRHDSLRTRIVMVSGVPMQQVDPPRPYDFNVIDLSNAPEREKTEAIRTLFVKMSAQGGGLVGQPLFAVRLLRIAADQHVLIWAVHHIVSDAYSLSLMFRQLWRSYAESLRGQPSSHEGAPTQYPDYAIWQRDTPQSRLDTENAYWDRRLAGAVSIRWPLDESASASKLDPAVQVRVPLGHVVTDALRSLCSEKGTTLGMAMMTACAAVISLRCGQQDFVLPVAVTGRDRSALETIVGYCAHSLYLRFQLTGEETLGELLSTATQEFHQALFHQDFGRAVGLRPDLFGNTEFQWHPVQQQEYAGIPEAGMQSNMGIKAEVLPFEVKLSGEDPFSNYHLIIHFWDSEQGLVGSVWGRPAFFSKCTLERLADDISSVAGQLAQNPGVSLKGNL